MAFPTVLAGVEACDCGTLERGVDVQYRNLAAGLSRALHGSQRLRYGAIGSPFLGYGKRTPAKSLSDHEKGWSNNVVFVRNLVREDRIHLEAVWGASQPAVFLGHLAA